jgi:hypothetical protein
MGKRIYLKKLHLKNMNCSVSSKIPVQKNNTKTKKSKSAVNINKISGNKEAPFTFIIENLNCTSFPSEEVRFNSPLLNYPSFSTEDSKNEDIFSLSDPNFNYDLIIDCERFFSQNTEEVIPNDLDDIKSQGNFLVLIYFS